MKVIATAIQEGAKAYLTRQFRTLAVFLVILYGSAFPGVDPGTVAQDMLPMMQAAKPRPGA